MLKYTTCDNKAMNSYISSRSNFIQFFLLILASELSKSELKQLYHRVCLDNSCPDYTTIQLSDYTNILRWCVHLSDGDLIWNACAPTRWVIHFPLLRSSEISYSHGKHLAIMQYNVKSMLSHLQGHMTQRCTEMKRRPTIIRFLVSMFSHCYLKHFWQRLSVVICLFKAAVINLFS